MSVLFPPISTLVNDEIFIFLVVPGNRAVSPYLKNYRCF